MTRGSIDLKVVGGRLEAVAQCLVELRALPSASREEFLADRRNPRSAESLLRHALESLFDCARHLLAKGYGEGALEYKGVARAARDRGLVRSAELGDRFERMAGFRNRLIHHYEEVALEELFEMVRDHLGDIESLATELQEAASRLAPR